MFGMNTVSMPTSDEETSRIWHRYRSHPKLASRLKRSPGGSIAITDLVL